MDSNTSHNPPVSKPAFWTGWILSLLPSLLILFSAVMKLIKAPGLAEGVAHLGLSMNLVFGVGVLELVCVIVYLIPATAVLGAILLTGLMGGAILTHLRVGEPFFAQAILGIAIWAGIFLREPRLRALLPFRK